MPDEIDNASNLELLNIDIALSNRPRPSMTFTGLCHFSECRQPVPRGLFCDADCREDHEIEQRKKKAAA